MGLAGIFLSSFVIAFSGAVMPGPMFTATMLMSSKRGFLSGPLIVMGHGTLEALLVIVLYFGFGELLKNHTVMGSIGVIGGIILLWMAYESLKFVPLRKNTDPDAAGNRVPVSAQSVQGRSFLPGFTARGKLFNDSAYIAGILTSLSNPYWIIWWVSIGLSYIVLSFKYGIIGIVVFYAGHILADLVWYSAVALSFSYMKRFITSKGFRAITVISGVIFVGFSAYFIWFGINNFIR